MKKFNYFDFLRGQKVTIREVFEEEHESRASYFTITLHETEEKVHIGVEPKSARLVKPNVTLFYATKEKDIIGYSKWKNGIGPLGMLP